MDEPTEPPPCNATVEVERIRLERIKSRNELTAKVVLILAVTAVVITCLVKPPPSGFWW